MKVTDEQQLQLKIAETIIGECPARFATAFATAAAPDAAYLWAWGAAAGRGMSRAEARRAAVFEAIERACSLTGGPSDPRVRHAPAGLGRPIAAETLSHYSSDQMKNLLVNAKFNSSTSCGYPVDELWIPGYNLVAPEDRRALPASAVLFGEDVRLGLPPVFSSSSGAALRDTVAAAARHGLLERLERDHVAIWWYNRLIVPRLDTAAAMALLPGALADWLAGRRRATWHLVLPSDLGVTAIVALSARADGTHPAIGAAAGLDPATAVLSATLEMLQGEIALAHMRAAQRTATPPPVPELLAWSVATNARAIPFLAGEGTAAPPDALAWPNLLARLAEQGIAAYVADLTRPEFDVPVVRVVSPELRDWQPRFAPGRLFDVPVALGLRDRPLAVDELNPVGFVI
ncbi:YcaO-like family protein [Acuticoccus sp. 2012]|uniref:YcaO-like family protein n=2 Tax=Acuticoccus mangrovi TaxID=2796142 RepID=A0A934MCA5_9HYPH|nr:YcaO-like family protein [Acuticoccus mangrovi]